MNVVMSADGSQDVYCTLAEPILFEAIERSCTHYRGQPEKTCLNIALSLLAVLSPRNQS